MWRAPLLYTSGIGQGWLSLVTRLPYSGAACCAYAGCHCDSSKVITAVAVCADNCSLLLSILMKGVRHR